VEDHAEGFNIHNFLTEFCAQQLVDMRQNQALAIRHVINQVFGRHLSESILINRLACEDPHHIILIIGYCQVCENPYRFNLHVIGYLVNLIFL